MNDETRRFGFSPSPAHGRVPGPYTPLQDEPQDAGDICTAVGANMKTVPVPQIQSMKAYILKHHRQMIFDALNESIRVGALEMDTSTPMRGAMTRTLSPRKMSCKGLYA